jgi:hypothetical protein
MVILGITLFSTFSLTISGAATSVELSGWNFSADLSPPWQSSTQPAENADVVGWSSTNGETPLFTGVTKNNAFWLPQENAAINPQDLPSYPEPKKNGILAEVSISVYKVPKEDLAWAAKDILLDYIGIIGKDESQKEIEFNGRPALLLESDNNSPVVNDQGKEIYPQVVWDQLPH